MRTMYFYVYFFTYLLYTLIPLQKMRQVKNSDLDVVEKDRLIHKIPKQWAKHLVEISGAKVKIYGQENMPNGAVLLVANHEGNFDIPILLGYLDKPFGFISKVEVKKIPIVAKWMNIMSCIFIDRKDHRQSIRAIKEGAVALKSGHSIVVFPEGTRSKGGPVAKFKSGSLRLAKDSQVPIVPIIIEGTSDIMEKNGGWIRPASVTITILKPLMPAEYISQDVNKVTEIIQQMIVVGQNESREIG